MKYTTLLLSGVPQKVKLLDLSYCLDQLFSADDEIGSFALRNLPDNGSKRQIALDFRSGFDAIAAQARLDHYNYKVPDGGEYTLCAKITWKEEFMRKQKASPEPLREKEGREKGAYESWSGMVLVPTVSDGAMYRANAKLDAQLELLKKQKVIIQTERKVLKEKRKLEKEYASMCDYDSEDESTISKRRRKSRSHFPASPGLQDLKIRSPGPKNLVSPPKSHRSKLKALMCFEEPKSKRRRELRSRSKDRNTESCYKVVNVQNSKRNVFNLHPTDQISMSKRSVSDNRSQSPDRSPPVRRSSIHDESIICSRKYPTRWSNRQVPDVVDIRNLIKTRGNSQEKLSRSTRSRSRERVPRYRRSRSPEQLRPLAIMPKSPAIIRSPLSARTRCDSLSTTGQWKEATITKYNCDADANVDIIPKKRVDGFKNKTDDDGVHDKITKASPNNVVVSKYTNTKAGSVAPVKNKIKQETIANKEKAIPSNVLVSKYAHTKASSETDDKEMERIRNIVNDIMYLMHNILEEISLEEQRPLSESQKAMIDSILNARVLNRIKPLAAVKTDSELEVVLSYRELYSKEEDKLLIYKLLDEFPKGTCEKGNAVELKTGMPWSTTSTHVLNYLGSETPDKNKINKEINANQEKAAPSNVLVSKYAHAEGNSKTTDKDKINKELSAIEEKVTPSNVLVSKYAHAEGNSKTTDKEKMNKELSAIKEKVTPSNVLVSKYAHTEESSETDDKEIEKIRNIVSVIMYLTRNILEEISLEEQSGLSENRKAIIDGILSARILNRIKPLVAAKTYTELEVVLSYRELYSKEDDTLLIYKLLDEIPKGTFEKDPAEVMDTIGKKTISKEPNGCSDPGLSLISWKCLKKKRGLNITFDKDCCPVPARPLFVLVLKKLLKQMKSTINTAEKKGLNEFPIHLFKFALKTMLKELVAGKGYMSTGDILRLFRAKYPIETDYVLVNQVVEDIKMGKYGKYTDGRESEDKDGDADDVILIENKSEVITVLDSDEDEVQIKTDQISEKPNLDDVERIKREFQITQHDEAEQTLKSQDQGNIVNAEPVKTTVDKETTRINKVTESNDKIPETQVTGNNVNATPVAGLSLPYLTVKGENANQTNSSAIVNCTEGPIQNIKHEIEPEFTDAAVENLLDSLKNFDSLDYVNDTFEKDTFEKETPQVTAITIMTSFSELISLKNEMNQSSEKVSNKITDKKASDIKIENDAILNTLIIKTENEGDKRCQQDILPTNDEGRDNNAKKEKDTNEKKEANDVRENNDCNKVIKEREVEKCVVDTNSKTVSREDEEECIESIIKYLDSICNE